MSHHNTSHVIPSQSVLTYEMHYVKTLLMHRKHCILQLYLSIIHVTPFPLVNANFSEVPCEDLLMHHNYYFLL